MTDEQLDWYWRPTPADGGKELGTAAGFAFDHNIDTLARETGQNSLDERLESEPTVAIAYDVIRLSGTTLDDFLVSVRFEEDLRQHLESASKGKQKASTVLSAGLKNLAESTDLILIRIADYEATGLTGPEYDPGRFTAVCRNILDSYKGSDTAGGSFGLGKFTMWATSQLGFVITNSTLSEPEEGQTRNRLFARLEVPWHEVDGSGFAGPAWFGAQDAERDCTRSKWVDDSLARDLFVERESDSPGTSFLIIGAYDPSGAAESVEDMARELEESVAANFWAALTERSKGTRPRLEVTVRTHQNREERSKKVVDASDRVPELVAALKALHSDETVDELTQDGDVFCGTVKLRVPARKPDEDDGEPGHEAFEHEVVVLVAQASPDEDSDDLASGLNRIVYLRGNGMTIRSSKLQALPLGAQPFRAIVLAGTAKGESAEQLRAEKFLRAAEPPSHDRWIATPEVTARYERGAATALKSFEGAVKSLVRETLKSGPPDVSDGPSSLKELLRLNVPTEKPKRPRIKKVVSHDLSKAGEWKIEATVLIPTHSGAWLFRPVLRFGTESGSPLDVDWIELEAAENCEAADKRTLQTPAGARTARFRATSDPASHPVGSKRARVTVDLTDIRKVGA